MKLNSTLIPVWMVVAFAVTGCAARKYTERETSDVMQTTSASSDPFLVPNVDLKKYAGDWFEIASLPRSFQSFCSKTKARYEVISEKEISDINTCKVGFAPITIQGTARVVDDKTNAVLEVTLAKKTADYRIISLDSEYQHAVVTNKERTSLFILSRKSSLEDTIYKSLLARAQAAGVDVSKVKKTQQN